MISLKYNFFCQAWCVCFVSNHSCLWSQKCDSLQRRRIPTEPKRTLQRSAPMKENWSELTGSLYSASHFCVVTHCQTKWVTWFFFSPLPLTERKAQRGPSRQIMLCFTNRSERSPCSSPATSTARISRRLQPITSPPLLSWWPSQSAWSAKNWGASLHQRWIVPVRPPRCCNNTVLFWVYKKKKSASL